MTNRGMVLSVLLLSAPAGCAYSNYQSAKMMPTGNTQLGVAISSYGYQSDVSGDEEAIELFGSHAMSDKFEIGGKFVWFTIEDNQSFDFLVVPKYSLIPDKLALIVPAGLILVTGDGGGGTTETDNAWMVLPGVVYTLPLSEYFELDLSGKPALFFEDDFGDYNVGVAANVGVRVTPPGQRWAVFPEVGVMWDDDLDNNDDYFLQFGLAFTWELGQIRQPATATAQAAPPQ
jgi:hypothetical protein